MLTYVAAVIVFTTGTFVGAALGAHRLEQMREIAQRKHELAEDYAAKFFDLQLKQGEAPVKTFDEHTDRALSIVKD